MDVLRDSISKLSVLRKELQDSSLMVIASPQTQNFICWTIIKKVYVDDDNEQSSVLRHNIIENLAKNSLTALYTFIDKLPIQLAIIQYYVNRLKPKKLKDATSLLSNSAFENLWTSWTFTTIEINPYSLLSNSQISVNTRAVPGQRHQIKEIFTVQS